MSARFPLGRIVATPAALDACAAAGIDPADLLARHVAGDWGDVCPEDARENELSVRQGFRILSSYAAGDERLWLITEAARSSTCLLLREEY